MWTSRGQGATLINVHAYLRFVFVDIKYIFFYITNYHNLILLTSRLPSRQRMQKLDWNSFSVTENSIYTVAITGV